GDEVVASLSAMPLFRHETGTKQDAEVLRDGWAAHLEMSRNRVDGAVGLEEEIQHPTTRGMANCPKDIRLAIGSNHHTVTIRKRLLTRQVAKWALSSLEVFSFCLCVFARDEMVSPTAGGEPINCRTVQS